MTVAMWDVVKNSQGIWHSLPNLPPFEREVDAVEFARRFATCNPNAPDLLGVRWRAASDFGGRAPKASSADGQGHIPGAWFATRTRLPEILAKLPAAETLLLTSPDGRLAQLAAAELAGIAAVPVLLLAGGTQAWVEAGLPLEQGATHMACEADDVVLSARERNQDREAAMREYLEWEINLVNDMASDDDHRFHVVGG